MSKEIGKLFTKKFSIDVAAAGHVKKHSRNEFNFEATTSKCQQMAYFDQHVVTAQCAANVLEQLNGFALGNNNYLPVQEHVAFLFDLMELALNIYSLLELCDSLLKELPEVEHQLQLKKSNLVRSYTVPHRSGLERNSCSPSTIFAAWQSVGPSSAGALCPADAHALSANQPGDPATTAFRRVGYCVAYTAC